MGDMEMNTDLLVIGGGPGGYGAAFRAADLGLDVTMVDQNSRPGGTSLHKGTIPSKAFLQLAELIVDAGRAKQKGLSFREPEINLELMRAWKNQVVDSMADDLMELISRRGILFIKGKARFESSKTAHLEGAEINRIRFKHAVVATGSRPLGLPSVSAVSGGRIIDCTQALALTDIPKSLLVVGGGYIGLELGSIYAALGSKVTLVERENRLLKGIDIDLVRPLQEQLFGLFHEILLETTIESVEEDEKTVAVGLKQNQKSILNHVERLILANGRIPNNDKLGLEHTGVTLDDQGFVKVNDRQQTSDDRIFAAGDVAGGVMLSHKATREGRVAAEVICGKNSAFDVRVIPAVVYTDPQISWCGLTEEQAKAESIPYGVQKFSWKHSVRARTMGTTDGFTKLLTEPETGRILGVGISGRNAEALIGEAALAIEMGALAEDLALTLHPHPTLSETIGEAAEIFLGSPVHTVAPPK